MLGTREKVAIRDSYQETISYNASWSPVSLVMRRHESGIKLILSTYP